MSCSEELERINRLINPLYLNLNKKLMLRKTDAFGSIKPRRNVRQDLTEEQRQEIKEAFDLFDTDKTGTIDYH